MDNKTPKKVTKELADELVKIAVKQLNVSNKYKKPLLEKWKSYDDLYAGKVKKKLRQQFNVALPVFSGMLDTLAASFDEPVELEFKQKHPADYFNAKKVQAAWEIEKTSTDKDARWDFKSRLDKQINIRRGRSILKYYAESDPKYRSVLEVVLPEYFHCQPTGGPNLENHLFVGQENIFRTEAELESEIYDSKQVKELIDKAKSDEYINQVTEEHREKLSRFQALGLNPDDNNYVGEKTYNLCEWCLTHKGTRYYLLFDPWTMTWVRAEILKDLYSRNLFPFVSWATHEDPQVFWSKAFADDIYPVADSIVTLFNQELTNREKRNMNAKAYDDQMFKDVAKLDAAQYRPDALVPVDTKGGSRTIQSGIYTFETPELQGTINLLDWVNTNLQKDTGITDIAQGASMQPSKKVNVAYMEQAAVAKRIGHKSQSWTEAWGEIGTRFVQGIKDHLTGEMYIEILGDMGIEPDVLTRDDLELKADLGVSVISSTQRKTEAQNKKSTRIEALKLLIQSQNINSEWRDSNILRYVGEFDEDEIKQALDTKNASSRESVAKAHICIQDLLGKKTPELNYKADATFLKIINDYMMEHRNKLGPERFALFAKYITDNAQVAMENAQRLAKQKQAQMGNQQQHQSAQPATGATRQPAPIASPEMTQVQQ